MQEKAERVNDEKEKEKAKQEAEEGEVPTNTMSSLGNKRLLS